MRLKDRLGQWADARQARLVPARNRGQRVWAIAVARHEPRQPLGHRYTLTDGTPCYAWEPTLAALAESLEV
jgi:hypothetical protein